MKYKHYAPNAQITIVEGSIENVVDYINRKAKEDCSNGKKVAIMTTDETKDLYNDYHKYILGSRNDELSIAKNLYKVLRDFDKDGIEVVYSESFENVSAGQAIMNRLIKAAGHKVVTVD